MRQSQSRTTPLPLDGVPHQGSSPSRVHADPETSEFYLWKVLFEQTPEAVAVLSADDRVVRINKEFTRLFGYEPDEVLGHPINDLIVPGALHKGAQTFTQMLKKGGRVEVETVRRRKDGSEIYVSLLAGPTPSSGRMITAFGRNVLHMLAAVLVHE